MATVGDCVKSFVNRRVFEEVVLTVVCRQQELSKHNTKHNTTQHPCFLSSSLSPFLPLLSPFACFLPLLAFLVQNNSDSKSRTTPRFREKKKQQNQSPPPTHTHTNKLSIRPLPKPAPFHPCQQTQAENKKADTAQAQKKTCT